MTLLADDMNIVLQVDILITNLGFPGRKLTGNCSFRFSESTTQCKENSSNTFCLHRAE